MFETDRFLIRPYSNYDTENLYSVMNTYAIYKTTYGIPNPCNIRYVKKWISNVIDNALNDKSYEYAIADKFNKTYLGNVGLINIDMINKKCDISYFVNPAFWGQGIATETSAELVKYAFTVLDMNRVGGTCMENNIASARVMEKLLMKYEGTQRNYLIKDGKNINLKVYSILKDEFFSYYIPFRK